MNRYSRVLHHISICDVKKTKLRLENNRKSFLESVRKAREFLRDLNSPYYSDWRNANIKEGMTTGSVFFTTFPATGSDTNLETIAANDTDAYTGAGGLDALNGASVKASGSGSGTDGGFNLGQSYLAFDGNVDSRHAILDPIDSSKFDTLVINAIVGNDSNGGEDPDEAGEELRLYYLEPDGSSFKSISVNPNGEQVLSANADVLIDLGAGDGSLQQFSIGLPSHARGEGFTYMLYQLSNSGEEFDHYGITSIKYQRRNPISLAVSLDSPEAVSMIRDGGNLTPAEKKKRLEDMLAASDEYMETQFPTNQEAMRRAEENLRRNIDISLDPNTFKFPEYGTPTYNQMYNAKIEAGSSTVEIERALEQQGLNLDNLEKGVVKNKGEFKVGREATLTLINNPDTQERALTALGIMNLVNNFTPDSYEQITNITNLRPGGTPATGWDGKFYAYDDPQLEASRVIPLETYTRIKGTDNYVGVERPDRAEPGYRYVMVKPYSFSQDSEARPEYTSVRNKQLSDSASEVQRQVLVKGGTYDLGLNYYYGRYINGYPGEAGTSRSVHSLRTLMNVTVGRLVYLSRNAKSSAYGWFEDNAERNAKGERTLDPKTEYDPLWMFYATEGAKGALELAQGLTSGRDLDSPVSYYTSNTASAESKRRAELNHQRQNDRTFEAIQKYLNIIKGANDPTVFEKDEWYIDDPNTTGVRTTHPYSGLPEPGDQPQEPQEPQEPTPEEKNYPPELNDIGGEAWEQGNTITKQGFKKADGDFDIFAAGGGNAKMAQGFTYEQVMEIGRKNLNVAKLKNIDNKGDVSVKIKGGNVQLLNYQSNLGFNAGSDGSYDTGIDYALSLASELGVSILTGQSKEMKIGGLAKTEMVNSVDLGQFEKALQIGPAIKPTVNNAVRPTPGKKLHVFSGIYDKPGAAEVHYNPATDTLTFTSNKMLRVGESGDQFDDGRQTRFGDIPTPSKSQIALTAANIITTAAASIGIKPDGGWYNDIYGPNFRSDWVKSLGKTFTDNMLGNAVIGAATNILDYTVQGSASNIVALRGLLVQTGLVKSSEMEKTGGGYGHVYSQTSYTGSEIPQSLRQLINRRTGKDDLGGGSLSDVLQGTGAGDAATVAADTQRKKKKVKENYEPKAKHNEKINNHPKIKSPKEFFKKADIKPVYPDTPPPEMINGRHPDLVDDTKIAKRFTKLDPESAKAMPNTGSPQIDALVRAARKKPK